MGEVYEGRATDIGRNVAIKRVLDSIASEDDLGSLFLREVAVAATLEHPNVVEVIDAGAASTELFLVMELVDGPSLAEVLGVLRAEKKRLPVELTCGIVSHVARGLAHAHQRALPDGTPLGIVHRDVAPENVLITRRGLPKVVDFGLAKLSGHSLTNPGIIRGRPRNLSPEQARGDPVDGRSDVFSLGAMMFEMVSGETLYTGDAVATLLWRVAEGDYEPIAKRLPDIDPDLIHVIERAIAVRPDDRYRSAREVERTLDGFRAARGMRVDSRAMAALVAETWPTIERNRWERLEGTHGELEGAELILEADRQESARSGPTARSGPRAPSEPSRHRDLRRPGGSNESDEPDGRDKPVERVEAERVEAGTAGTTLSSPSSSELPKPPSRPKEPVSWRVGARGMWLAYLGALLVAAIVAFASAWWATGPHPAHSEVDDRVLVELQP